MQVFVFKHSVLHSCRLTFCFWLIDLPNISTFGTSRYFYFELLHFASFALTYVSVALLLILDPDFNDFEKRRHRFTSVFKLKERHFGLFLQYVAQALASKTYLISLIVPAAN